MVFIIGTYGRLHPGNRSPWMSASETSRREARKWSAGLLRSNGKGVVETKYL